MPLPAGGYGAPAAPQGIPLADSWLRFAARLLDRIIMLLVLCIPTIGISGTTSFVRSNDAFGGAGIALGQQVAISLISGGFVLLYDGVATGLMGGTLMKRAFGMRVVNQSDGLPVSMTTALIRALPRAICHAIPVVGMFVGWIMGIVSLIFLFSDKLRQTVSDKVAKTVVIKAN